MNKFFLAFALLISTACSGSTQGTATINSPASADAEAKRQVALQACIDGGGTDCKQNPDGTITPGKRSIVTRRSTLEPAMVQPTPGMQTGIMNAAYASQGMAPYVTAPQMLYADGLGSNTTPVYGAATIDAGQNTEYGVIRFRWSSLSEPREMKQASGISLSIDGNQIPIGVNNGTRIPQAYGDFLMANGQKVSRMIYVAPMIRNYQEAIRYHLQDAGDHTAQVCYYFMSARPVQGPMGVTNAPYHALIKCVKFNVSINYSTYFLQQGYPL